MANYLLRYYHPAVGKWCDIQVTSPSVSIGRTPGNTLALNDKLVSRKHAALYFDERGVQVLDQRSANGVRINGQRIPPGQWIPLPLNTDFSIGVTTLRVELVAPAAHPAAPVSVAPPAKAARPPRGYPVPAPVAASARKPGGSRLSVPLLLVFVVVACLCLAGSGVAGYYFLPGLLRNSPVLGGNPGQPGGVPAGPEAAPPTVIDSLSASAGGEAVKDDQGAAMSVPAGILQNGEQVSLERANLSPGMKSAVEKSYSVDSLAYAVKLPAGEDMVGNVTLQLPAKSPDARLAVLVDDAFLGVLETPQQNGVFTVTPRAGVSASGQGFPDPGSTRQGATRYLVVTPKGGSSLAPRGGDKLASLVRPDDVDGKSCVAEKWTLSHCWRNPESTIYVFWQDDFPPELKDQEYLRIVDTIKAVNGLMTSYSSKGFTGGALTSSKPLYIVVEASAKEPYYSNKTGNVYVNWKDIGDIASGQNSCVMAHELLHWIESASYYMNVAAVSNPRSWWLEMSAENGTFLLDTTCIDRNLTTYGLVTTSDNVLGFQAAPFRWEGNEQARYVNALQFYLSLCDGGPGCALTQDAWISAINGGSYPMEGGAQSAYEMNAKDLGRYLLGAPPAESRAGAFMAPATATGNHYGDYLALQTSGRGIWDYGLTMNQFSKVDDRKMQVQAKIFKGGAYPLMVSNGTATPMGGGGKTGLPGLLEIQPGSAFWLKKDQGAPEFFPEGKSLVLGPISNKLGVGSARIIAVAPDGDKTFQAALSLVDLSGDWTAELGAIEVTPVNCPGYKKEDNQSSSNVDTFLQMLSAKGTYTRNTESATDINLTWNGSVEEAVVESDVKVEPDKVILHYTFDIPQPDDTGSTGWLPWKKVVQVARRMPETRRVLWLSALPVFPAVGLVTWLNRRRKRWARAGLAVLIIVSAWILSGCFGLALWGTIEATYTFKKLEYVGPTEIAQGTTATTDAPLWKLSDGKVDYLLDLKLDVETTDTDGNTTKETSPCIIKATGTATGTIGPEGSVTAPAPDN